MEPGGTLALGWPPIGAFGSPNVSSSYPPSTLSQDTLMQQHQEQPVSQAQQGMRHNLSTDSLSSYFESRVVLAEPSAAAGPSGHGMDPLESLDSATLGRLLPDLESPTEPDAAPGTSGRPSSSTDHTPASAGGRPMRRSRIGSVEDDIFSAVGGLELGHEAHDGDGDGGGTVAAALGDHMLGEAPSRSLFVRNVGPEVLDDDIRALFQSQGEVRTLYTACKHRGFVVVSYHDLRSATRAHQLLQGQQLAGRSLELHFTAPKGNKSDSTLNQGTVVVFNLDPDTTDEQLVWIFSKFGDVREIRESPTRKHQKFIEFYDVRHAAAAMKAMNKAELSAHTAHHGVHHAPHHPPHHPPPHPAHHAPHHPSAGRPPTGASSSGGLHSASSGASSSSGGALPGAGPSSSMGTAASLAAEQQAMQQRGMVRPASGIINTMTGASPVSLGPMSQSWDPATDDSSLLGWLGRGQGAAAASAAQQQLQQQQAAQQQLLRDQAALQQALQQGLGADALLSSLGGGVSMEQLRNASGSTLSKLASAAQLLGGAGGRGANLHVSDSASSIASTTASVPLLSTASSAGAINAQLQQSLAAQQQQAQQQQQQQQVAAAQHAAVQELARAYGSSDQLQGMETLLQANGRPGLTMNNTSFGSGLNLADDATSAAASLMAGSYQTGSYPQLQADQGAGMYGLRSLSNPALAATAAAAAAAAATQQSAMAGQLWGASGNAAAMLNAQAAAAAGMGGLGYPDLALRQQQQQQQQQLALQLAGLQAGLQARGLMNPGGLTTAQLLHSAAAAGLLPPALPGAGLLPPGLVGPGLAGVGGLGLGQAGGMGLKSASTNSLAGMGLSGHLSGSSSRHSSAADLSRTGGSSGGGRLSRRATDPVAEAERKAQQEKLFALDPERIRRGDDKRTTLMIKNIPNKYTQRMLLQTIDEHCAGSYDFFYLPIDFKNKCNVGYAFINMLTPDHIVPLVERFDRRRWDKFNSEKVCHISYARIQGRAALVAHFQNSSLMHEDKRCRPVLFQVDGPEAGEQEPFPVGPNVRPRGAHLGFRDTAGARSASRLG